MASLRSARTLLILEERQSLLMHTVFAPRETLRWILPDSHRPNGFFLALRSSNVRTFVQNLRRCRCSLTRMHPARSASMVRLRISPNSMNLSALRVETSYTVRQAQGLGSGSYSHLIGSMPCFFRYVFVLLKGLLPKNPFVAEKGDGCADSSTTCFNRSMIAPFCRA